MGKEILRSNRISNLKIFLKGTLAKYSVKKRDYSTWVFSSSSNIKYNYNSKYLFEHVMENEKKINPIYVVNDDELRYRLQKEFGEKYFAETKSFSGIKKVLNAGVWFTSAGLPVYGHGLNDNRIIVNLWHAVPIKKMALMENNLSILQRLYFNYLFSSNYTYVLTTSEKLRETMSKIFGVEKDIVKVWGQPRNDAVFKGNDKYEVLSSIYIDLPVYKKIILYAPTFRDNEGTIFFPFSDFESSELDDFLDKNEMIIFIRCHQSEVNRDKIKLGKRVRLMNQDKVGEIMDIINIFDLLITDYSSIYVDYLLTEKPLLFLPYDIEIYDKERGLTFDYENTTPGPKPTTLKDFEKEVHMLLNDDSYYSKERHEANLFFNDIRHECSADITSKIKNEIKRRVDLNL